MLQMISFAGGMVLAVISAFRADLSTLYLFGMITFLLIMWFESPEDSAKVSKHIQHPAAEYCFAGTASYLGNNPVHPADAASG
ncbi:hypothetical protein RQN30_09620 [Arcanobacterium hippocoleae]